MTHVVTSTCVDHKYQECVAVCLVEAFREAETYLVIDPDECIDCGVCVPECPPTPSSQIQMSPKGKRLGLNATPKNPSVPKSPRAIPPYSLTGWLAVDAERSVLRRPSNNWMWTT